MTLSVDTGHVSQYLEVIPGLRIVAESPRYQIRANEHDGHLTHVDGTVTRFKLINSLCRPEEMTLFNADQVARSTVKGFSEKLCSDNPVRSVCFNPDTTGLRTS